MSDLSARQTPAWFDEAKLGVFVHWNPAAIPAYAPLASLAEMYAEDPSGVRSFRRLPYAEMYWNTMSIEGSPTARHHAEHHPGATYEDFVARFRDEMIPAWDPAPWAELAERAGARYLVFTTKMEDGFLQWPSRHRHPARAGWQSERDVVGELAEAVRARGLRFGAYYCGGVDWTFQGLPVTSTVGMVEAMLEDRDYLAYADAHWRELIERYEPSVLWNDLGYPSAADLPALFGDYFARVPDGVVNNRFQSPADLAALLDEEARGATPDLGHARVYSDFLTPEYSTDGAPDAKWETCRGLGQSFGYNRQDSEKTYISATQLIHDFVDVVARGGNMLINLGPTATGAVPWLQAERLLALGWWLEVNGDAIYRTRPWDRHAGITGEGQPVRYTASADRVHAIVLGTPGGTGVDLDVRLAEGAQVTLAGVEGALPWAPSPAGVRVTLPEPLDDRPATTLHLEPRAAVTPFDETA